MDRYKIILQLYLAGSFQHQCLAKSECEKRAYEWTKSISVLLFERSSARARQGRAGFKFQSLKLQALTALNQWRSHLCLKGYNRFQQVKLNHSVKPEKQRLLQNSTKMFFEESKATSSKFLPTKTLTGFLSQSSGMSWLMRWGCERRRCIKTHDA